MARDSQQKIYLVLCKAYAKAIQVGAEAIEMNITWVEEILEYLDGSDNSTRKVAMAIDDLPQEEIEELLYGFGHKTKPKPLKWSDVNESTEGDAHV